MVLDPAANFVRGETDSSTDDSQTTISVADTSIFPDPSSEGEYNLVLWDADNHPRPDQDSDVEVVRVTATDTSNDELTVDRGQEGTSGASHPSGSALQMSPTAKMFSDIESTFNAFYDSDTSELTADVNNSSVSTDNASVTNAPVDATDVTRKTDLDGHVNDTSNPHSVTNNDVNVVSTSTASGYEITIDGDVYEFIEE